VGVYCIKVSSQEYVHNGAQASWDLFIPMYEYVFFGVLSMHVCYRAGSDA